MFNLKTAVPTVCSKLCECFKTKQKWLCSSLLHDISEDMISCLFLNLEDIEDTHAYKKLL